ncbi:MAG: SDR family oxidoreductase [Chitinophagaceae bacterium]|nr:SDR family oxidoreductase [Chitinophagaceae bacterium]
MMASTDFNDCVSIVTGAGQGIGYEICRQLSFAGSNVILNDLDPQLAAEAAKKITDDGGACIAVAGDVGDTSFTQQLVNIAVERFGKLDIAIANAGITLFSDFFDYTPESFYKVLQVNMGGTFFLAQAAARQMKSQQQGGSILFTSSVVGHQAHKNLAAYAMTKAGIEMLAKNLVIELAQFNINVNAIAPGATLTERTLEDKEYEKTWSRLSPTGRPSTAADIAAAALFLVSKSAKQITGQTLIIDGGWSAISPSPF